MNEMTTIDRIQTSAELQRCPLPVPFGWYFIDTSASLAPSEMRNIDVFDQEWVMFRGEDGKVGIVDPFCPHLGAHLGHGGKVVEGNIRCPFHHWEYDTQGWCKKIPYAKVFPPIARKKAILRALPIEERYGNIFAWYHPEGAEPLFPIPDVPEFESDDYVEAKRGMWVMETGIQELAENGVDFPHLKYLHGNPDIPHAEWSFDRHIYRVDMNHGFNVGESHGPGINIFRFTTNGVSVTMFSTSQPVKHDLTHSHMQFTHKKYPEGSQEAMIAQKLLDHMVGAADGEESAGFESVDMIIWNNKKYRPEPLLCDGDGPILQYRKWFRQFYAEPVAA